MIRFCDREVSCVMLNDLDRSTLLSYFLQGHRKEIICVLDENGAFYGIINYTGLLQSKDIYGAICTDAVVLDETMWKKAREYFFFYKKGFDEVPVLPLVDRNGNLISFAYEDKDANRQIRMLRELTEKEDVLQFMDIYPEYDCVTIHECNELAWYFAKYLQKLGIPVCVEGEYWSFLGEWENVACLEYRNYHIYAEGIWQKCEDLSEYLLRSVSVCFECIDKIYEENIFSGKIQNADGNLNIMLQKIRNRNVFVLVEKDVEEKAEDVCDILLGHGIEIKGFVTERDDMASEFSSFKKCYHLRDVVKNFESPIVIQATEKSSAWGLGETDIYDYRGFYRNESFFLIEDYLKVEPTMLCNTLKGKKVVLVGRAELCEYVYEYLTKKQPEIESIGYWDILEEKKNCLIPEIMQEDVGEESIVLVVEASEIWGGHKKISQQYQKLVKKNILFQKVKKIVYYFSKHEILLKITIESKQYLKKELLPKGIILGVIESYSGNTLVRGIMDGHPEVIMLDDGFLNSNLLSFCMILSGNISSQILKEFWSFYSDVETDRPGIKKEQEECFSREMEKLLELGERFTPQELFVMIHVAYARMKGRTITDINKKYIYWEPHAFSRVQLLECAEWISDERIRGLTIQMIRNRQIQKGSYIRRNKQVGAKDIQKKRGKMIKFVWDRENILQDKEYLNWNHMLIRFEDLKCNCKEVLTELCESIGLTWSDTLLETTKDGKQESYFGITGFDLKPVYNLYEEYFSAFDRMKLLMTHASFQKQYGYPYVDCRDFSRSEIQEMFLKDARYEREFAFINKEEEIRLRKNKMDMINQALQKNRRDFLEEERLEIEMKK